MLCTQCNKNKESRLFEKGSPICKVCIKGPSKSVAGGSVHGSTMINKKRAGAPLNKDAVSKKIANENDEEMKGGEGNDGAKTISDQLSSLGLD